MSVIKNARIRSTMLGIEDHGILTAMISVEGDHWGIGFGGYTFDHPGKDGREGHAYGMEWIRQLLEVLEVGCWEDLKGTSVRIELTSEFGGTPIRMGHFLKDNWLDPKELAKRYEDD